jgi:hypothetical protein
VRRVELELASGLVVEFADRERALGQVEEFAVEGTRWPVVVFGLEGCGKTAFLRQAAAMLRDLGYDVFYLHPLDRVFSAEVDDPDVKRLFLDLVRRTLEDERWGVSPWPSSTSRGRFCGGGRWPLLQMTSSRQLVLTRRQRM